MFDREKFINFILENKVVGFFEKPVKLKSGRLSYYYANWRNVSEDVYLIDKLSDFILEFVSDMKLKPDCFYGVPEGATKIGVITQYKYAKANSDFSKGRYPLPMGRGKIKEHGIPKDRYFVGVPKGKVIVIEDVTTTGSSLIETIKRLKEVNAKILAAISLTDRMEIRDDGKSVRTVLEEQGIPFHAMSTALDLLPKAYKLYNPEKEIGIAIEKYFEKYGVEKIKLVR